MGRRFDRITVGTGIVRIIAGIEGLVANNGIPDTEFYVQAVSDWGAQRYICLLDGEVSTEHAARLSCQSIGVRTPNRIHFVTSRPLTLIQGPFDRDLNYVQVEAILLPLVVSEARNRSVPCAC